MRFYIDVGTFEVQGPEPTQLTVNRQSRGLLERRGHKVTYVEYAGGHDFLAWRMTFPDALAVLLRYA
jgi:enterochelin esterase family protein